MTILVTGGTGKLGKYIKKLLPDALYPTKRQMDITNEDMVRKYIYKHDIEGVIHCAAMTGIRECDKHRVDAYRTNVLGTYNLAKYLVGLNFGLHFHEPYRYKEPIAYFMYINTACIFSGDDEGSFYSPMSLPFPKNYYGLTKYLGELVLRQFIPHMTCLSVRTNFIEAGKWPYEYAFTDRFANYLYVDELAEKVVKAWVKRESGLKHWYGREVQSMFEWAQEYDKAVKPMTIADYEGPDLTMNMVLGG